MKRLDDDGKASGNANWLDWDHFLQHWGIKDSAAALIESSGPMNIFLAQIIHVGQPILHCFWPDGHLDKFAEMLEDQQQSGDFVSFLRSKENA